MRARDGDGADPGAAGPVESRPPSPAPKAGAGARLSGRGRVALIGALILAVGLGASTYFATAQRSSVAEGNQRAFQVTAADVTDALSGKLTASVDLTRTMRALATLEPGASE